MSAVADFSKQLEEILPQLREVLSAPSLMISVDETWSSNDRLGRQRLRQAIVDQVGALRPFSPIERETLLRLDFVPDLPNVSVSISHTQTLGGFAYTLTQTPVIGLDLEKTSRVQSKAVARISKPQELLDAPSFAHLWVAKEAAFKALRGHPKVLSNLTASAWRSVSVDKNLSVWSCEVHDDSRPSIATTGLAVELSGTTLGLFLAHP